MRATSRASGPVLVFGTTGQVARALNSCDWSDWPGFEQLGRREADLGHPNEVQDAIVSLRPQLVINAAAYTDVDRAESEPELARAVNADAPAAMAKACRKVGAALIHISTDYVFDGAGQKPYREDDAVAPLGAYGKSKEQGERHVREGLNEHVILRTAWVYAPEGRNFVNTMLRVGAERDLIRVVDDQWGCPTAARSISHAITLIASAIRDGGDIWGTYHYSDQEPTTWYHFAEALFDLAEPLLNRRPIVEPIVTDQYPTSAARPRYSVLDSRKFVRTFGMTPPPWRHELAWTLEQIAKERGNR